MELLPAIDLRAEPWSGSCVATSTGNGLREDPVAVARGVR